MLTPILTLRAMKLLFPAAGILLALFAAGSNAQPAPGEKLLRHVVLFKFKEGTTPQQSLIADCTVLDLTRETSRHYANVVLELRKIGKPIPANDLWIAALSPPAQPPALEPSPSF